EHEQTALAFEPIVDLSRGPTRRRTTAGQARADLVRSARSGPPLALSRRDRPDASRPAHGLLREGGSARFSARSRVRGSTRRWWPMIRSEAGAPRPAGPQLRLDAGRDRVPAAGGRVQWLCALAERHGRGGIAAVTGAHFEGGRRLQSLWVYLVTGRGR